MIDGHEFLVTGASGFASGMLAGMLLFLSLFGDGEVATRDTLIRERAEAVQSLRECIEMHRPRHAAKLRRRVKAINEILDEL